MKHNINFKLLFSSFLLMGLFFTSCNKDEDELPTSSEPISFLVPDTSTVFAQAGSEFNYTVFLAIDKVISSLSAGYLIDLNQSTSSISFSELQEVFFSL